MSRRKLLTAVASSKSDLSASVVVFRPVVEKVEATVYKPAHDPNVSALKQELRNIRKVR